MPGFSSVTGQDSIMYADNVCFDGTKRTSPVTTDGQLLIGSTAAPHIKVALPTASNGVIVTPGSGTLAFSGDLATANEALLGASTTKLITPATLNDVLNPLIFTGFQSWAAGAPFWSVSGTDFTLLVGGTGFIDSKEVAWTGPQTLLALSAGATHYVYIDSTGTIGSTTTRTDALYQNFIVLFEVLVDSSVVSVVIVSKENHPYSFPTSTSNYLHETAGTVIENDNNGANITLNGTQKIQINGADTLNDHGLLTAIPDSGGAAITWRFMYTNGAGKWIQNTSTDTFPSSFNSAGTITALTAGRFATFRLFVAKDSLNTSTPEYYVVYDTSQYTSQANANTAIANGTTATSTAELQQLELCQLGFVTVRQSTGLITNVVINKATLRSTISGASSTSANLITTDTSAFTGWLDATDTTVQASLNTLDQVLIGGTAGQVALSQGAAAKPLYKTPTSGTGTTVTANATTLSWGLSTPVSIANGGTNATTFATTNGLTKFDGTRLVTSAAATLNASNYLTNTSQPSFGSSVYTAMTNVTGNGTQLTVIFDHAYFNASSSYNAATGVFTAPVAGTYLFTASVTLGGFTSSHTLANLTIYSSSGGPNPNVQLNPFVSVSSSGYLTMTLTCVHSLALNATLSVLIAVNGGTKVISVKAAGGADDSSFSGCLLC